MDKSNTPVVVHIVGSGGYAAELLEQAHVLANKGCCRLGSVVVDPRFTPSAEYGDSVSRHTDAGWRVHSSFTELIANETLGKRHAELLVLPVPIPLHCSMTVTALKAGFDVLCEKPAAGSLDELEEMRRTAEDCGRSLWFGFQYPLSKSMGTMLEMVATGAIGEIAAITSSTMWPRPESYYRRASWAGKLRLDGIPILDSPAQNAAAHFLHACLEMAFRLGFGAHRITAEHARVHDIETADLQVIRIATRNTRRYSGPVIHFIACHSCLNTRDPVIEVVGESGTLRWEFPDTLRRFSADVSDDRGELLYRGAGGRALNALALRATVETLAETDAGGSIRNNLVDVAGARRHLQVVTAAFGVARRTESQEHRGSDETAEFCVPAIPNQYWSAVDVDDERYRVVHGIEDALGELSDTRALPSERSLPWAPFTRRVTSEVEASR